MLRRELGAAGVAPAELHGGTVAFGGRSWIDGHAHRPAPDGEASGEVLI